ncbi:purine/pyrimidine permease [Clostridium faecium]|uniref:purine/pyrimidine permease n=1 Tax=Clostridium faecium TaxID=2762223 RepID=UPI0036F261C1
MINLKLLFGALQWTAFIIASAIVVPIATGQSFGLNQGETAGLVQSTFFVLGTTNNLHRNDRYRAKAIFFKRGNTSC